MTRSSGASEEGRGKTARHALVGERRQPRQRTTETHVASSWSSREGGAAQGTRTSSPAVITDGPLGLGGPGGRGRRAGEGRGVLPGKIWVCSGAVGAQTGGGMGVGGWGGRHGGYEVGRVVFGLHPGGGIRREGRGGAGRRSVTRDSVIRKG